MPKSTTPPKRRKAAKPPADFPLWQHPSGRWCKKIRQRFHYFGKVADDPDGSAALEQWLDERDDLLAGRVPRPKADTLTVKQLCDAFYHSKVLLRDAGELSKRTTDEYFATCTRLVTVFGRERPVDDLTADDFQQLRSDIAKQWGPVRLGNEIQRVRSVFKFGYEAGLIEKAVRFGPGFKRPSAKVLRLHRANGGLRMFEAAELRKVLDHAGPAMKAMVLLAANGGLGNTDVAELPIEALALDRGWLNYPRRKTGIERRIPLWRETLQAIRDYLDVRKTPKGKEDSPQVFLGGRGSANIGNHIAHRFKRVLTRAKVGRKGLSFYAIRHTFQTVAEGARDLAAVQAIMGHAPAANDMSVRYRERVDDARLRAVTDHVRAWLFGGGESG